MTEDGRPVGQAVRLGPSKTKNRFKMIKSRFCSKNDYAIKTIGLGLKTLTFFVESWDGRRCQRRCQRQCWRRWASVGWAAVQLVRQSDLVVLKTIKDLKFKTIRNRFCSKNDYAIKIM